MIGPPSGIIELAEAKARLSPCAKSKRGAAVWRAGELDFVRSPIVHLGFNGPPAPFTCDGSAECRATCNRRCAHAESRAIVSAIEYEHARGAEMLHVKINGAGGSLIPGGPPSCWQCSRDALEAGIAAVWLFEADPPRCPKCGNDAGAIHRIPQQIVSPNVTGAVMTGHGFTYACHAEPVTGVWRRYTAEEFHRITCANAKGGPVYVGPTA